MSDGVRTMTAAIARGDTEAMTRFYRIWFDFVFAQARSISQRDEQFCLDIVQETMMRVIRNIKPMNDEVSIKKWLVTVIHSCCYDQFRCEQRRKRRERSSSEGRTHAASEIDDRLEWVRLQLLSLSPEDAHLLSLRFRLGWTLQRIGRAMGLKTGAVDGRISRMLNQLRRNASEDKHE